MELGDFGTRSGFQVPRANIGAMRFPKDDDEAVALIRHAIDSGMRYIDTSRGYGDSEIKLGKALKDGYREKVILSTKWSPWVTLIEDDDDSSADCVRKRIEESMRRLDVDYLDFYQVWNIDSREHYDMAVESGGMVDGIRKAIDEGLVGHTGFTTHDTVENLLVYLDEADWCEVLLVTHNLLNDQYVPVLEAAHERGIGTIVMNPVGGGKLTEDGKYLAKLAEGVGAESVPDLAIRYLMSNPNIDTIISGISKGSDVDSSIASVDAGALSKDQMARIHAFLEMVSVEHTGFCTGCGYCMPCPNNVDIREIMAAIYDERYWGLREAARQRYTEIRGSKAEACTKCGQCAPKCTQHLDIPAEMAYALKRLAVG
ncbi:MAG: aldo/keto reductase [FCB group bacterium]|jgi:predicted aldo/keto reductase-like oxidoreductase|nr:aldo/keto reductase [FCB group bacterium]